MFSSHIDDLENRKDPEEDVSGLVLKFPKTGFRLVGFSGMFTAEGLDPGKSAKLIYAGAFAGLDATPIGTISDTI